MSSPAVGVVANMRRGFTRRLTCSHWCSESKNDHSLTLSSLSTAPQVPSSLDVLEFKGTTTVRAPLHSLYAPLLLVAPSSVPGSCGCRARDLFEVLELSDACAAMVRWEDDNVATPRVRIYGHVVC
jgi:hypothetical protein